MTTHPHPTFGHLPPSDGGRENFMRQYQGWRPIGWALPLANSLHPFRMPRGHCVVHSLWPNDRIPYSTSTKMWVMTSHKWLGYSRFSRSRRSTAVSPLPRHATRRIFPRLTFSKKAPVKTRIKPPSRPLHFKKPCYINPVGSLHGKLTVTAKRAPG